MLKTLDILIGVATVMLLFSMAVTIITQAVATVLQSRGRNLLKGIIGLLRQIDPNLPEKIASQIATQILKHPLVAGPGGQMGDTVHREELTMLLLELAADETPNTLNSAARAALVSLLEKNGVPSPAETLKDIRAAALQLEAANPALANDIRHGMAILQEAKSQFVAKVHGWFDQTIDRVGDRFTLTARIITFLASLIIAFSVQLDTFALVDRLSIDDSFRNAVQSRTQALLNALPAPTPAPSTAAPGAAPTASPTATPAASPSSSNTSSSNTSSENASASPGPAATSSTNGQPPPAASSSASIPPELQQYYYDLLSQAGLVTLPGRNWAARMAWGKVPGILFSTLLLSLGAPFWYSRLQDLLRLRSMVAQKDEQQRMTRQTTQAPDAEAVEPAIAVAVKLPGEKGDPNAVG